MALLVEFYARPIVWQPNLPLIQHGRELAEDDRGELRKCKWPAHAKKGKNLSLDYLCNNVYIYSIRRTIGLEAGVDPPIGFAVMTKSRPCHHNLGPLRTGVVMTSGKLVRTTTLQGVRLSAVFEPFFCRHGAQLLSVQKYIQRRGVAPKVCLATGSCSRISGSGVPRGNCLLNQPQMRERGGWLA
jgi:hypothetical protein